MSVLKIITYCTIMLFAKEGDYKYESAYEVSVSNVKSPLFQFVMREVSENDILKIVGLGTLSIHDIITTRMGGLLLSCTRTEIEKGVDG